MRHRTQVLAQLIKKDKKKMKAGLDLRDLGTR